MATVTHQKAWNSVEVLFSRKPSTKVLDKLKDEGFKWSPSYRLWWKHYSDEAEKKELLKFAKSF